MDIITYFNKVIKDDEVARSNLVDSMLPMLKGQTNEFFRVRDDDYEFDPGCYTIERGNLCGFSVIKSLKRDSMNEEDIEEYLYSFYNSEFELSEFENNYLLRIKVFPTIQGPGTPRAEIYVKMSLRVS